MILDQTVSYEDKEYYVDILGLESNTAEIWFRVNNNASSLDDLKASTLSASNPTYSSVKEQVCRYKKVFDSDLMIAGCLASIGAAFCAAAIVESGGAATFACSAVIAAVEPNLAICLDGLKGNIAEALSLSPAWAAIGVAAGYYDSSYTSVISNAIDLMCADVENPFPIP